MAENLRIEYKSEQENEFSSFVKELKEIKEEYERTDLLVIRARLYIEFIMEKLILAKMDGINSIDDEFEDFSDKFTMLNKLYDVDSDVNTNIKKLNEMRNIYAHTLELEVANQKVVNKSEDLRGIEDSVFDGLTFPNSKQDNILSKSISTFVELASMDEDTLDMLKTEGFTVIYDEI